MVKHLFFCLLLSALGAEARAQLTCTNCITVNPGRQSSQSSSVPSVRNPITLLGARGQTYEDVIYLTGGTCVLAISGTGEYNIKTYIETAPVSMQALRPPNTALKLSAPAAGNWGGQFAGVIFRGASAYYSYTYEGERMIEGGYIVCNKGAGIVSIPGDIIMRTNTPAESGLWFGANGQLGGNGVLTFETNTPNTILSLNK